ncbi:MAG TPA: ATP-binding cassette domain-containing protein [Crocinitomix sp.]|nr:ATP-binding cassette domain-containing protein [Crocinitomix sp.]
MHIQFNNVVPHPLADLINDSNKFWGNTFAFKSSDKVILNAVSGKGKSTFISILSGLRKDFKGDILFDGKSIKQFSQDEWIIFRQSKISTIYQGLKLFENLTVEENIILKNNLTQHLSLNKIKQLIKKAGLEYIRNKKIENLSFGQQQRVAILRAFAQPFELLLMDEPFSHLDIENQKIMIELIEQEVEANQAGFVLTSLNNTHQINYNKELCL